MLDAFDAKLPVAGLLHRQAGDAGLHETVVILARSRQIIGKLRADAGAGAV